MTADLPGVGVERALAVAYRYLNRRERTQAEMRAHLEGTGIDRPEVERAIGFLVEEGHLDDRRFARLFAQDKGELEGWGGDRIRHALVARGVDPELVQHAVAEQESRGELERALAVLRRRFPSPARDRRERERALGVLVRKGYDMELALDAIAAHARDATHATEADARDATHATEAAHAPDSADVTDPADATHRDHA